MSQWRNVDRTPSERMTDALYDAQDEIDKALRKISELEDHIEALVARIERLENRVFAEEKL